MFAYQQGTSEVKDNDTEDIVVDFSISLQYLSVATKIPFKDIERIMDTCSIHGLLVKHVKEKYNQEL